MITGGTTFGIVRKRMADLYNDFAARIKADGAFGPLTTVDNPDLYKSDPLVQLAAAASASDAELWEVVEFHFKQFDSQSSSGRYLEAYWGIPRFGLARQIGEDWAVYEAKIKNLIQNGAGRYDPPVSAMSFPGVECAAQVFSTPNNPIEGMAAGTSMIVIKACDPIDYDALAAHLWATTEYGIYDFVGDNTASADTGAGGCVGYNLQPACPIVVDLLVSGYPVGPKCVAAGGVTAETKLAIIEQMNAAFSLCQFGTVFRSSEISAMLDIDGFITEDVTFRRRAPELIGGGCDAPADAPLVEICGAAAAWVSDVICKFCSGEVWCGNRTDCLRLNPWEYPVFNISFVEIELTEPENC